MAVASPGSIISRLIKSRKQDLFTPLYDEYLLCRDQSPNRLDTYVVDLHENSFRPPGRLSPSSIGTCKRKALFSFVAIKGAKIIDPVTQRIFDRGDWVHHEWKAICLDMEQVLGPDRFKVLAIEKKAVIKRLFIRGALDILVSINGNEPEIIDVKTQNERNYNYKATNGPDESHIRQITTYLRSQKLQRGLLLNDDKNTQNHRIDVIEFDQDVWNKIVRWCNDVLSYITDRKLPPRHEDCEKGSWMARNCPYSKFCYGGMDKSELRDMCYEGPKRSLMQEPKDWWNLGMKLERRNRTK